MPWYRLAMSSTKRRLRSTAAIACSAAALTSGAAAGSAATCPSSPLARGSSEPASRSMAARLLSGSSPERSIAATPNAIAARTCGSVSASSAVRSIAAASGERSRSMSSTAARRCCGFGFCSCRRPSAALIAPRTRLLTLTLSSFAAGRDAMVLAVERANQRIVPPLLVADHQDAVALAQEQAAVRHRGEDRDRALVAQRRQPVDRLDLGIVGARVQREDRVRKRVAAGGGGRQHESAQKAEDEQAARHRQVALASGRPGPNAGPAVRSPAACPGRRTP